MTYYSVDGMTYYDVDKVIDELKHHAFAIGNGDPRVCDGLLAVPLGEAIEILERGGVTLDYYFTNEFIGDSIKIKLTKKEEDHD